jgi:transposase
MPEQLLRAMLLQLFYAICSERLLVGRLDFDLSFRWFVGLGDRVWDASTFSKNRNHLLAAILDRPQVIEPGQHRAGQVTPPCLRRSCS